MNINLILNAIAIAWLFILSSFLIWLVWILRNLVKDSKGKDFVKIFKSIEEIQSSNSKEIASLRSDFSNLTKEALEHIQKVGLVKFNPFNETGGDHSFSLVLLDGNKNGIIITSLHTRERTRLYTKVVKSGKSAIELSNEESKALSQALR